MSDLKLGLALSGGGAAGDFEVGVVRYLYDSGRTPSILSGTSVGSLNALKLAEGDGIGGTNIWDLERIWLALQTNHDMYVPASWMDKYPNLKRVIDGGFPLGGLALRAGIGAGVGSLAFFGGPVVGLIGLLTGFVVGLIIGGEDIADELRSEFQSFLGSLKSDDPPQSLYVLEPIRILLRERLNLGAVVAGPFELFLSIVSLDDRQLSYVAKTGQIVDGNAASRGETADVRAAVLASAAQPPFFPPVKLVDTHQFVDGGAIEVLPVEIAVRAGADHVIAVSATADPGDTAPPYNIVAVTTRTLGILEDVEASYRLAPWADRITLIRPLTSIHDGLTIDPGLIRISLDSGYWTAWNELDGDAARRDDRRCILADITSRRVDLHGREKGLIETPLTKFAVPGSFLKIIDPDAVKRYINEVQNIRDGKNQLADALRRWILAGGPAWTPYPRIDSDERGPSAWFLDWERHNGLPPQPPGDFPNVLSHALWSTATWSTGQTLAAATPRAALPIPAATTAVSPTPFVNQLDVREVDDPAPTGLVPSTVTVTAVDASDGTPLVGTVLADGRPVGRIGVPFTYTFVDRLFVVPPRDREVHRRTVLEVAASGYPLQPVNYGVQPPSADSTPVVTSVAPTSGHPEYQHWMLNPKKLWIIATVSATAVSIRGRNLYASAEVPQVSFGALQATARTTTGAEQLVEVAVPAFAPRPGGGQETVAITIKSSLGTISAGEFTVQIPEPLGDQPGIHDPGD